MGNTESEHSTHSDSDEDDKYHFHKKVLKEGAKPVKGSGPLRSGSSVDQGQLPDTPESLPDEFADAKEDISDGEEGTGSDASVSGSGTEESGTSFTGSSRSRSTNSRLSASDRSVSNDSQLSNDVSGSSHDHSASSHDQHKDESASSHNESATSHDESATSLNQSATSQDKCATSHDKSATSLNESAASHDKSTSSLESSKESSTSGDEPRKLPNRIRVIDTSESEGEEEMETSVKPAPGNHGNTKKLLKPVAVHPPIPGSSGTDNVSVTNKPVKRKADDMLEESPVMAVNVKKNGGLNRPFAQKRKLREVVSNHLTSSSQENVKEEEISSSKDDLKNAPSNMETSQSSASNSKEIIDTPGFSSPMETSDPSPVSSNRRTIGSKSESAHRTEDISVPSETRPQGASSTGKGDQSSSRFEHSKTSPFKNFHLQPSSSTTESNISETAKAPRPENVGTISSNMQAAKKRPLIEPSPSTSSETSSISSEHSEFDMFQRPASIQRSAPTVPVRGNSNQNGSRTTGNMVPKKRQDTNPGHWTSELPKVNVAAAEKKFEGVARASPGPSTSDWKTTDLGIKGDKFSFLLGDEMNVHICYDDIITLKTDALVNPTDGQLTHVSGVARKIAMTAGAQMTNQCQFFLKQHGGPLEVTEVTETYACGALSGRVGHVIHLAAPLYQAANEKDSDRKLLQSYLNCLTHINDKLGLASVVFPCIGSGSYPQDTCINIFFEAVLVHLAQRKMSRIKSVKFVLNDVHSANLAVAMVQAHLERIIMEGMDVVMAEALNSYYGNSEWERHQNDLNDQLGRQLEVDSPKKLFRGPPVKRPRL